MLGVMDGVDYRRNTLTLEPGECLFLYTDGVTEAMNQDNALFCDHRLVERLTMSGEAPLNEMADCVAEGIRAFTENHPQHDDITMLAVRYTGTK